MASLLKHQLGLRIIVMVIGLFGLVTIWQLGQNYQHNSAQLNQQVDRLGSSMAEVAAAMSVEPLLILDYSILESYAQSLVKGHPDITFASFLLSDGRQVATWPQDSKSEHSQQTDVRDFRHSIKMDNTETGFLGEVVIGIDTLPMQVESQARMRQTLIRIFAAFLFLTAFLGWWLRRELSQPLEKLAGHALTLGQGNLENPIPVIGRGELGSLSHVIEEMRQRLDKSLKRSEQLAQAKDDFLATMSHEIRTPMNGVQGMLSLLVDGDLSEGDQKLAQTALDSAEALHIVLNDILDISKLESGQFTIEQIPFSLRDLVNQISQFAVTESSKNSNNFQTVYLADCPETLIGDPTRLRQILLNLVGNALKFTKNGHIALNVECLEQNETNTRLKISVKDSGIGVPPERHQHIFSRFTQTDTSTTRVFGGTGLGLAISYQLVTLMGGTMGLNSAVGEGSEFYFEIEFLRALESPVSSKPAKTKSQKWDGTILLVDDNKTNLLVGSTMLKRKGCQVTTATNGQEALDLIQTNSFDLVLMDIMMPVMDGLEATKMIRSQGGNNTQLPIIATTANAMQGDRERYLEAGMDDYIAKPIRGVELDRVLGCWLAEKTATPSP